jgi:hypothetical protein
VYYVTEPTIPANTEQTDPYTEDIQLCQGTIRGFHVGFPKGCAGLVHVQLYYKTWQILPWTRGNSIAFDGHLFDLPCTYPLDSEPFIVKLKAWNDDDAYFHTLHIGILLDEGEIDPALAFLFQELARWGGM